MLEDDVKILIVSLLPLARKSAGERIRDESVKVNSELVCKRSRLILVYI